jgi:hypothetical protein
VRYLRPKAAGVDLMELQYRGVCASRPARRGVFYLFMTDRKDIPGEVSHGVVAL